MDFVAIGIIEAIAAALLTFFLGKDFMNALKAVGASALMLPIVFIFVVATTQMWNAPPENVAAISNDAITRIVSYFTDKLPGVVVSDAMGAIIGSTTGFFISLIVNKDS